MRDGEIAMLKSRIHRGPVRVRINDDMAPGVVSLPHGWGHADSAPWQRVAGERPGVVRYESDGIVVLARPPKP